MTEPKQHPSHQNRRMDIFQCPLCNAIPEDERESFLCDVKFHVKKFNKGDVIIAQGAKYTELFILVKGETETEMADEKGDFMRIDFIAAPNPLAIGFLFAHDNRSPVTAIAKKDCVVVVIPKDNVHALMCKYDAFMLAFLGYISNKISFLSEKLRMVSLRTIRAKLAYYLLKESNGESSFSLEKSKEEISRLFGVSRPALVNVLMQMNAEDLIDVDGRHIEIKDRLALQKML